MNWSCMCGARICVGPLQGAQVQGFESTSDYASSAGRFLARSASSTRLKGKKPLSASILILKSLKHLVGETGFHNYSIFTPVGRRYFCTRLEADNGFLTV